MYFELRLLRAALTDALGQLVLRVMRLLYADVDRRAGAIDAAIDNAAPFEMSGPARG